MTLIGTRGKSIAKDLGCIFGTIAPQRRCLAVVGGAREQGFTREHKVDQHLNPTGQAYVVYTFQIDDLRELTVW